MEFYKPPEEHRVPPECVSPPENEFYGQKPVKRKTAEEESKLKKRLLRMILMPTAAVFASFPLLAGLLGGTPDEDKTAAATETPAATVLPAETPAPTPEPTAEPTPEPSGDWDAAFPKLDNMTPDFPGNYAWAGTGPENSEEYIFITSTDYMETYFIEMGGYYRNALNEDGSHQFTEASLPGASYDPSTNTLTLRDFTGGQLEANLMGNGFTLRLEGENRLSSISVWGAMYGGSLTITGPGSLTVDAGEGTAIVLNCENSGSCIMIAGDATVELLGARTIFVGDTTLDKALYFLMPIEMIGGSMQPAGSGDSANSFEAVDESGAPATHIIFRPMQ